VPSPWPAAPPTKAHRAAFADALPRSFWLDTLPEREPHPPLERATDADLCIVGGGYTGLWAALYAKQLDPARDVVLLEATRCGNGASGRNGGFVQSSLTHGTRNGLTRFPNEIDRLERLGRENYDGLVRDLRDLSIDAELEQAGDLVVALEPREIPDLADEAELLSRFGYETELLDAEGTRTQIDSPLFLGALWTRTGSARSTEATELALVRHRPLPFPPEPLRSAVIQFTRNRLAAADRNDGRRGVWLKTLDRLGLGFDS
jgi:glycine/D-amino acid oxidase-like deaminating enzyme